MTFKERIKNSKLITWYYEAQTYIDIGWGEVSWWDSSLIQLMAYLYVLEKIGIIIEGEIVVVILISLFVGFYFFGIFLKTIGVYDKSVYIEAEIDPFSKELLEAARIIIEYHKYYNSVPK